MEVDEIQGDDLEILNKKNVYSIRSRKASDVDILDPLNTHILKSDEEEAG